MKLYLVHHGEAKSKEEDPDRNLTEKGLKDAQRVVAYASSHIEIKPAQIIHSGKTRARQTADIWAKYLKPARGIISMEYLNPMDNPAVWAERVSDAGDDLMLVGHLPHIKRLTSLLLCGNPDNAIVNFQNGGIVCLMREESGNWAVCWLLLPSMISYNFPSMNFKKKERVLRPDQ